MSNTETVKQFIGAWNEADLEKILSFLTQDCFYHNIPFPPTEGLEAIRASLAGFTSMAAQIDWVVHQIAENAEGAVLTERTDRFLMGEKWLEIRVMGTFEFRDGKISAWRDYFDSGQFQSLMS